MMIVDNKFDLKQIVYLKTDKEQGPRLITAIVMCADGGILYELSCCALSSRHYDFEITIEKDVLLSINS